MEKYTQAKLMKCHKSLREKKLTKPKERVSGETITWWNCFGNHKRQYSKWLIANMYAWILRLTRTLGCIFFFLTAMNPLLFWRVSVHCYYRSRSITLMSPQKCFPKLQCIWSFTATTLVDGGIFKFYQNRNIASYVKGNNDSGCHHLYMPALISKWYVEKSFSITGYFYSAHLNFHLENIKY